MASGAFWGPNFVLQGPTKVYIFVVYSRNILKNATEMLAFVHSKVLFFVLQGSTNAYVLLCIFTQLKNNYKKNTTEMEASGAFWGPKFVLQGLTKLYKLLFVYSRSVLKKNATEIVATGAFWDPKFVLQGPSNVYISFLFTKKKMNKTLKCWPLVHSEVNILSGKVLLWYTFFLLYIHAKLKKKYHWNGGLWCFLRS